MNNTKNKVTYKFNECNIYILLWILYYFQGILYEEGSFISRSILLIVLFFSFKNMIVTNMEGGVNAYFKSLNMLLIMFTLYGVIAILFPHTIITKFGSTVNSHDYLKNIYLSLLPIYSFYYYAQKGVLHLSSMRHWTLLFFIIAIIHFYHGSFDVRNLFSSNEATNNSGYAILALIPLVVFWKNKPLVQYMLLGLSMVLILISVKRGAILIGAMCVCVFMYQSFKYANRKVKLWLLILSLVIVFAGIYVFNYMLESSAYFGARLEMTMEGQSSGRDSMYRILWDYFNNSSDFGQFLFGQGANATVQIVGNYAHNDWLEILIDNGLVGGILYFIYWLAFHKEWRQSKKNDDLYMLLGLTLLICFMKTLFSMSYADTPIYTSFGLGYALAVNNLGYVELE